MKKAIAILTVLAVALILYACGQPSAPTPVFPSRQQQLNETGLFDPHKLCGVATDKQVDGSAAGAFTLFFGNVSSETIVSLKIQNKNGNQYYVEIPRGKIILSQSGEIKNPQVTFVFKPSWLNSESAGLERDPSNNIIETNQAVVVTFTGKEPHYTYTVGAINTLTNFIKEENLDNVNVVYPATGEVISDCWSN